ncbi:MAG TPA: hypothetical protein V6C86_12850 [Oculatellaceae cyanobacterium]
MKSLKIALITLMLFSAVTPAFAGHHRQFARVFVNPGYSGYSNHAYYAQQHAFNAQQHARMDALYASPQHAHDAWHHAMEDSHHAEHDLHGY